VIVALWVKRGVTFYLNNLTLAYDTE